ncbi:P-type conjugative transfer protein VirB9 [Luteibacter rhizovicinus]|nr:P-type conjugative transfer protein VirB9 [Luteibacter rhizovicinus]
MLAVCTVLVTHAETVPVQGTFDHRMKTVRYNRSDVVRIVGHYGYSTDIEFAQGEAITHIAIGDSLAWEVAPAANHLFVKPREDNAVTNMTVVTDRHVYQFSLDASKAVTSRDRTMFFQVRFAYPDDDAARERVERDARIATSNARRMESALKRTEEARNWNYHACGAKDFRPSEVYDDGRFTYMRFPGAQRIPAIFAIDADGSEGIVNGAMRGDQFVVHTLARRFVLRLGNAVACIENRTYNAHGTAIPQGTTSPNVVREINDNLPATGNAWPSLAPIPAPADKAASETSEGSGHAQ